MTTIYLSSTYEDLKGYREVVYKASARAATTLSRWKIMSLAISGRWKSAG